MVVLSMCLGVVLRFLRCSTYDRFEGQVTRVFHRWCPTLLVVGFSLECHARGLEITDARELGIDRGHCPHGARLQARLREHLVHPSQGRRRFVNVSTYQI